MHIKLQEFSECRDPLFFLFETLQNKKNCPFFVAEESALIPLVKYQISEYKNTTIDPRTI
jgi:hypothetical protein